MPCREHREGGVSNGSAATGAEPRPLRRERPAPGTHGHVKRTPRQPPLPGGLERVHAERIGAPVVDEAFRFDLKEFGGRKESKGFMLK